MTDFLGAIGDVFGATVRKKLFFSALLTAGVWGVLMALCWQVAAFVSVSETAWLAQTVRVLGFLAVFVASLFLLPALTGMIASLFSESVLKALTPSNDVLTFRAAPTVATAKIAGMAVLKNVGNAVVFVPLCFLTGFIPVVNFIPVALYYLACGRVAGRECFLTTALCFVSESRAEALYKRHRGKITRAGILIAFLMTVPVVNVISPLIATAFMRRLLFGFVRMEK